MKPYYKTKIIVEISGPNAKRVAQCARKIKGRIQSKTSELLRLKKCKSDNICFEIQSFNVWHEWPRIKTSRNN